MVEAFLLAHSLAGRPEVAARWDDESACQDLSVGGLTVHLLRQAAHTVRALIAPPPLDPPIGLLEHYERAEWTSSAHDDPANVSIRTDDNRRAEVGPISVLAQSAAALARLPGLIDRRRDPDWVHIPWQGWNLATEDFLVTRSMEVLVHSDGLASSVQVEAPPFPYTVTVRVVDLLSSLSIERHGTVNVIRALSRPQRAPRSISAF